MQEDKRIGCGGIEAAVQGKALLDESSGTAYFIQGCLQFSRQWGLLRYCVRCVSY